MSPEKYEKYASPVVKAPGIQVEPSSIGGNLKFSTFSSDDAQYAPTPVQSKKYDVLSKPFSVTKGKPSSLIEFNVFSKFKNPII